MEGLLSFLLFGDLFFLMMRYGCGAHMAHGGHGKHGKDSAGNNIDPVCGMEVDIKQGYGKMHEGLLYRFCSRKCMDQFEVDPKKYLKQSLQTSGGGS
jgi:YHS domain-containing protein